MTLTDKLIQCLDVDMQNMPENGFVSPMEVLDFYRGMSKKDINQIYISYYGNKTVTMETELEDMGKPVSVGCPLCDTFSEFEETEDSIIIKCENCGDITLTD